MSRDYCERAIEILERTHDGNDLDPRDLYLIQWVINASTYEMTEEAEVTFEDLYNRAVNKDYKKPWFHGVVNLTRDHQGYIYWRGIQVEHYDYDHWQQEGWREREKAAAIELGKLCLGLEQKGIKVTGGNVMREYDRRRNEVTP